MAPTRVSVWGFEPAAYQRHGLHAESCAWVEKNCYADLWIELLHAAKLEPTAAFAFTVANDFDGEQWSFYKPPHLDLTTLYGVVVQELTIFKPLLEHALFHAAQGRLVLTEADAFWLPDTRGTDYRTKHTKTTIAIETIELEARRLGYFHNAGYYSLEGEDFARLFGLDAPREPDFLPLFAELAFFDRARSVPPAELAERSELLLRNWLRLRPSSNPLQRFAAHFEAGLPDLRERGIDYYHAFAFATVRQCGSGFELAAAYLRWLERLVPRGYETAAAHFEAISSANKALILKGARAVSSKKPADFSQIFAEMAQSWDAAMTSLDALG